MESEVLPIDRFVQAINHLALLYPFSVTSWFRSEKRNKLVGGQDNSYHLLGLAVDVVLDDEDDKVHFMRDCKLYGLKVIDEISHVHVQYISTKEDRVYGVA